MDVPAVWWPFALLAIVDCAILFAYAALLVARLLPDLDICWPVSEVPFLFAYGLCLIFPLTLTLDGIVYKLSSEIWWVECTTVIAVVACSMFQIVMFSERQTHQTLLLCLTVVSVMLPCIGLHSEEHQIFYFVVVTHVLHVIARWCHIP